MAHPLEPFLLARGIAPTPVRLLVLDVLRQQPAALSLADVEQLLEHTDRITLHRTLKTFAAQGLVHRVEDGSGAAKYALCEAGCTPQQHHDRHVHFYCYRCQQTVCLPRVPIPAVPLPAPFQVQQTELVMKGVCEAGARQPTTL